MGWGLGIQMIDKLPVGSDMDDSQVTLYYSFNFYRVCSDVPCHSWFRSINFLCYYPIFNFIDFCIISFLLFPLVLICSFLLVS